MTKNYAFIIFILGTLISGQTFGQPVTDLLLRTESKKLQPNLEEFIANTNPNQLDYQIISFKKIPSQSTKESLQKMGILFLEYIPNNSYLVKFETNAPLSFLKNKNISGVYGIPQALKLDYRLIDWNIPQHAKGSNDKVKVALITMNETDVKNHQAELSSLNITPYQFGQDKRFAYCELAKNEIFSLVNKSWIRSIELIDEPGKPESTEGRSIQKSNLLNSKLSNGLTYNGAGVSLLVRDDGLVGPHIDYEGRLINLTTDATGTHGDGVAGVMGPAGNIDPSIEGGSSGANIYVINYNSTFQANTLSLHLDSGVMITNSSYSNGCNAGYTSSTQTVDKQIFDNPTLMHVFSAGNSNNNNCGYGAGNQWGNVTGGHKMGKNVITVANLFNDGSLVSSSSRGPAHDGRIKPDLAAHGQGQVATAPNNQYMSFGGTSAAAPSLAGNLGQLIEAYRDLNSNSDPKSALIKAAALNSATDLGNPGPDFKYGYGLINTARAYDIIANNQYVISTIAQSGINNHTVNVPAGTGQLRVMVYWHEPEATLNTNKALINDLNMTVNGTLLPLVLDATPNATTLDNPAVPGIDSLNNMEQVVVNNPAAGNFAVQINGFQVPVGPQEYVLVYTFIPDAIKVTYPIGGESLIPGNTEIVHWDAFGNLGNFTVDYSTNNGSTWTNIGTANGDERNISWNVPAINTADALIRVSRASQSDVSDEGINIFPVPVFTIQNFNATSMQIDWPAIPAATQYYIWRLGAKFMEVIDSSATNQYFLSGLGSTDEGWLSVSANTASIKGERANAKYFDFNPLSSCSGCFSSINNFPHFQSFETGSGNFCQDNNDDIDFTLASGSTPSSNTGPSNASDGSEYIYVEATNPNFPSKVAILGSPCYDLTNKNTAQLNFDYHMYGAGMGDLDIEISTDGGQTWSTTPIWTKSGDQGNQWLSDSIDLSSYQMSQVSYRFVATTGTAFTSDIALDNLLLTASFQAPLAVNYLNWEGHWQNQYVNLLWTTSSETNNSHFIIERSIDNRQFENIGKVAANVQSLNIRNYSFTDKQAKELQSEKIYYRLRQVDNDGKTSLSSVVTLQNPNRQVIYTIQPNPSNGIFNLNTTDQLKNIKVINSYGQIIQNMPHREIKSPSLNLKEQAAGIYFVILTDQVGEVHRLKVSKL